MLSSDQHDALVQPDAVAGDGGRGRRAQVPHQLAHVFGRHLPEALHVGIAAFRGIPGLEGRPAGLEFDLAAAQVDSIDGDAALVQLQRQLAGEHADGALGHGVAGVEAGGPLSMDAADVDDPPAGALFQIRNAHLRGVEVAADVDLPQPPQGALEEMKIKLRD